MHFKLCQKFFALIHRGLEHRYLPYFLALIGFVITLPAVRTGWEPADDLRHRVKLISSSRLPKRLFDLGLASEKSGKLSYVLSEQHTVVRTEDDVKKLKDYGALPWWTCEGFRFSNWRPLDSFTHWLDYRFYPNSSPMIHVHNILWLIAVIFLVTMLYHRLMIPGWIAGLAALLYLLDTSNYVPAAWIVNRNLLISVAFGILALLAHHRWRSDNSFSAAVLVVLFLLCSLLATEAGIATFAYLFAYAIALDRGHWIRRALSIAPAFLIVVGWRVVYSALGHGAYSSAIVDPGREPIRYGGVVLERAPILLMGQWGWPASNVFNALSDQMQTQIWLIAVISIVSVFVLLLPLLLNNRIARFWFIGMLLSVLPICATLPANRNLLFMAIGSFGLIAQFIAGIFCKQNWIPISRWWRLPALGLCVIFLLVHVVITSYERAYEPKRLTDAMDIARSTMQVGSPKGFEKQDLVAVSAPITLSYLPPFRIHKGKPLPQAIRILTPALRRLEVIRTDEKTLLIRAQSGNLFTCEERGKWHLAYFFKRLNDLVRHKGFSLRLGQKVVLPRLTVQVISVDNNGITREALCQFSIPLDDPSLYWVRWDWRNRTYVPFGVPDIGESTEIAGPFD